MSSVNKKAFVESIDIVVGVDEEKKKIKTSLNKNNAYLFVSGIVGSGKTTFINRLVQTIEQNYSPADVSLFSGSLDTLFLEVKKRKEEQTDGGSKVLTTHPLLVCLIDDVQDILVGVDGNPNTEMNKTFLDKVLRMNPHEVGIIFVFASSWHSFSRNESYREYIFNYFESYIFFGGIPFRELFDCTGIPVDGEDEYIQIGHGILVSPDSNEEPITFR